MASFSCFGFLSRELSDEVREINDFWKNMSDSCESNSGNTLKDDHYAVLAYLDNGKISIPKKNSPALPGKPVMLLASKKHGVAEIYDERTLDRIPLADSDRFTPEEKDAVFGFVERANAIHDRIYQKEIKKIKRYKRDLYLANLILKPLGL